MRAKCCSFLILFYPTNSEVLIYSSLITHLGRGLPLLCGTGQSLLGLRHTCPGEMSVAVQARRLRALYPSALVSRVQGLERSIRYRNSSIWLSNRMPATRSISISFRLFISFSTCSVFSANFFFSAIWYLRRSEMEVIALFLNPTSALRKLRVESSKMLMRKSIVGFCPCKSCERSIRDRRAVVIWWLKKRNMHVTNGIVTCNLFLVKRL